MSFEDYYASLPTFDIKPLFDNFSTLKPKDPTNTILPYEESDGTFMSPDDYDEFVCIYDGILVTEPIEVRPFFEWNPTTKKGYISFFTEQLPELDEEDGLLDSLPRGEFSLLRSIFEGGWDDSRVVYDSNLNWKEQLSIVARGIPKGLVLTFEY